MKKLVLLSSALLLGLSLSLGAVAQEAPKAAEGKPDKAAQQDRVEGTVIRTSKEHSTITVRERPPLTSITVGFVGPATLLAAASNWIAQCQPE